MKKNTRIYLSLASGILLTLSFPPMPTFFLAFISFVPMLFLLDNTKKFYFWNTYLTFFLYQVGSLWWISSFQEKTDPFLMMSGFVLDVFHPIYFMFPIIFWLVLRIRLPRRLALYTFPFVWTSYEWARELSEMGFPWLSVGYTQVYNTNWVQIADLFGVFGTSFFIVLANVFIYDIIYNYQNERTKFNDNKFQLSFLFLIVVLPIVYSNIQIAKYDYDKLIKTNETVNIGLVQPNIDPWDKWSAGPHDQLNTLIGYTDGLIDSVDNIDLIIWPETSILFLNNQFNTEHDFTKLNKWIDTNDFALLTGFVDLKIYNESNAPPITKEMKYKGRTEKFDNFNSALLIDKNGFEIYHKMKLTPFGERVPHVEIFTFLTEFIDWGVGISFWGKGTKQKNLALSGTKVDLAPIICIESIYPSFVRKFSYMNANLLTVITNDAWYDYTPGPEQHALISAFRAIESKKFLARAANSGVTCFISPTGSILHRADQYKQTSIAMTLPIVSGITPYVLFGNWLVYLAILVSFFFFFYAIIKKSTK